MGTRRRLPPVGRVAGAGVGFVLGAMNPTEAHLVGQSPILHIALFPISVLTMLLQTSFTAVLYVKTRPDLNAALDRPLL